MLELGSIELGSTQLCYVQEVFENLIGSSESSINQTTELNITVYDFAFDNGAT